MSICWDGLCLVLSTQPHVPEERSVLSQSDWKNFYGKLSTGGLSPFGEVLKLRRRSASWLKIKNLDFNCTLNCSQRFPKISWLMKLIGTDRKMWL